MCKDCKGASWDLSDPTFLYLVYWPLYPNFLSFLGDIIVYHSLLYEIVSIYLCSGLSSGLMEHFCFFWVLRLNDTELFH